MVQRELQNLWNSLHDYELANSTFPPSSAATLTAALVAYSDALLKTLIQTSLNSSNSNSSSSTTLLPEFPASLLKFQGHQGSSEGQSTRNGVLKRLEKKLGCEESCGGGKTGILVAEDKVVVLVGLWATIKVFLRIPATRLMVVSTRSSVKDLANALLEVLKCGQLPPALIQEALGAFANGCHTRGFVRAVIDSVPELVSKVVESLHVWGSPPDVRKTTRSISEAWVARSRSGTRRGGPFATMEDLKSDDVCSRCWEVVGAAAWALATFGFHQEGRTELLNSKEQGLDMVMETLVVAARGTWWDTVERSGAVARLVGITHNVSAATDMFGPLSAKSNVHLVASIARGALQNDQWGTLSSALGTIRNLTREEGVRAEILKSTGACLDDSQELSEDVEELEELTLEDGQEGEGEGDGDGGEDCLALLLDGLVCNDGSAAAAALGALLNLSEGVVGEVPSAIQRVALRRLLTSALSLATAYHSLWPGVPFAEERSNTPLLL